MLNTRGQDIYFLPKKMKEKNMRFSRLLRVPQEEMKNEKKYKHEILKTFKSW